MATKVEPTPTLTGDDADRFIQKLNIPSKKLNRILFNIN